LPVTSLILEQNRWREADARLIPFIPEMKDAGVRLVLDLGCGAGRNTEFLARQGFTVVSLDSAEKGLKATGERLRAAGQSAYLVGGDMADLPFADASLDAVVSVFAIHHNRLARIEHTAAEIRRVLRPGGLALLDVYATASWRYSHETSPEIEPRTFLPDVGNEAGTAHRYFDEEESRRLFSIFHSAQLYLNEQNILHVDGNIRYHAQWTAVVTC
jgi:tellurite methyltransferase